MVVYYTDLAQYKIDTENGERKVETLKRQEDEVNEVVLGNKLNNIQQTEIEVSKWNAIGEIGRAVIELRRDSQAFYSSMVPLHQVGAAMCATVVINEKRELEMVVDTGCSSMSLPHAIAVECGVNLAAGRDSRACCRRVGRPGAGRRARFRSRGALYGAQRRMHGVSARSGQGASVVGHELPGPIQGPAQGRPDDARTSELGELFDGWATQRSLDRRDARQGALQDHEEARRRRHGERVCRLGCQFADRSRR